MYIHTYVSGSCTCTTNFNYSNLLFTTYLCTYLNYILITTFLIKSLLCVRLDNTIRFERTEYRGSESSTPPRPRLVLSKTPTQTFRVTIEEITCQSTLAIG